MFTYYLNSLHEFREKNLELGQASTRAWLELVAHFIDGLSGYFDGLVGRRLKAREHSLLLQNSAA